VGAVRKGGGRARRQGGGEQAGRPHAGAIQQVDGEAAFEAACRSLAARRQSRAEVAYKLARKGFSPSAVEAALDRATRLGFLDDTALAADAARTLAEGRLYGRRRVAQALAARGLDPAAVEGALHAVAPPDPAAEAARARTALARGRRLPPLGDAAARRRAALFLARRGFDWDAIELALGPAPPGNE
jgi:regulatory protein